MTVDKIKAKGAHRLLKRRRKKIKIIISARTAPTTIKPATKSHRSTINQPMTTSHKPVDDALTPPVSLIRNTGLNADHFHKINTVQQNELSSKLDDSFRKTFEATKTSDNPFFGTQLELAHMDMETKMVPRAKVLKPATSTSAQKESGFGGILKIATLDRSAEAQEVVQRSEMETAMTDRNGVKQELQKRLEALEKQQQQGAKSQKGRLEQQDLTRLLSCLNVTPFFSYRETIRGLNIKGSRELIKNILTCFAAGVAYNIPVGYNIKDDKNDTTRDACRKDLRDKLLIHLKNLTGHLPRIEEEKDGSYSLHYA